MSSTKNIILKSSDGEFFEVEMAVAREFKAIYYMIDKFGIPDNHIPLPNVTGKILSKVIEYFKVHVNADGASSVAGDDLRAWAAEFFKVDQDTLYDLILAAKYLDIKGLLDLACQTVADRIKSTSPEEIRKMLNIKVDLTPEEEEEVRRANQWAFDFIPMEEEEVQRANPWAFDFTPEEEISIACNRLPSVMEFFRKAKTVRLRSRNGQYLVAEGDDLVFLRDEEMVRGDSAWREEPRRRDSARWSVEFVDNSDSVLCLRSCYSKYLTASDQPSLPGMTGCKVLQSLPSLPDSSHKLEPVMEGTHVKLRTHYGTLLRANGDHPMDRHSITHDLPHRTTILWDVEIVEREEEEGSTSDIEDKASEEGSATKSRHETGEGSCVTKSRPGDSGLIGEGDKVRYRRHFWKLKSLLLEDSGRKDVLVSGGSGTAALVREVCADVREHFGTIAWVSIPRSKESELHKEIFVQLVFERVAFPQNFDRNPWMLGDHEFSLQQEARCLIVVDDLEDEKTRAKFEQILHIVEKCQVIFIARGKMDSSYGRINQYGRKFETYKVEDLSYVPREYRLKNFLKNRFPVTSKDVGQLIVKKCERLQSLPTAIVFVLRDQKARSLYSSSEIIKDEWEARIPSVDLCHELHVIQQLLKTLYKELHVDEGHELDHIQEVMEILCKDDHLRCFRYLGIFPGSSLINCKRVSRLWAAEGILTDLGRAERFFDDPLWRKCIHPVETRSDGELSTFRVDERVLEIIVSLFDLRQLVTITRSGSTNRPERVRYLSALDPPTASNEDKLFLSLIFVLDVSSNEDKTTTSEASPLETSETPLFPFDLKDFRVLDLESAPFQIVQNALKALFKLADPVLRYLSLSNTSIKVIPSSIGKLTRLEFLVLKQSLVTELPPVIQNLKRIRHILIYHHKKDPMVESYNLIGFKVSCGLGGFSCLEKLCFVEAGKSILKDLGNLTKLKRLGIAKLRATDGKLLCASLGKLEELKSLNVHAFDDDEIIDLHYLSSPPKNLKRLYLHGRLEKLPDWISSLDYLTKIILRWSHLEAATQSKEESHLEAATQQEEESHLEAATQQEEDLLTTLGKLPNLVELELRQAYNGRQLDFKGGQFPKLKILLLDELGRLRSMSLAKGTMPCLEDLTISRCQWLERIPMGIEDIATLQALEFFDMSPEFYKMVPDKYRNSEGKPKVYLTQWRPGQWKTIPLVETSVMKASQVNTE